MFHFCPDFSFMLLDRRRKRGICLFVCFSGYASCNQKSHPNDYDWRFHLDSEEKVLDHLLNKPCANGVYWGEQVLFFSECTRHYYHTEKAQFTYKCRGYFRPRFQTLKVLLRSWLNTISFKNCELPYSREGLRLY